MLPSWYTGIIEPSVTLPAGYARKRWQIIVLPVADGVIDTLNCVSSASAHELPLCAVALAAVRSMYFTCNNLGLAIVAHWTAEPEPALVNT